MAAPFFQAFRRHIMAIAMPRRADSLRVDQKKAMEHLAAQLIAFIKANPGWAVSIIGITAFGESFAFVSLLFPGTAILIASGSLVSAGVIPFFSTALAGILGAVFGDAISFWLGQQFGPLMPRLWPFRTNPSTLQRGVEFFNRYGGASVFIGRFLGPLRAVVPIAAGIMRMPPLLFYIANVLSAIIWAPALIVSGALIAHSLWRSSDAEKAMFGIAAAVLVVIAILYWARQRFRAG